MFSRIQLAALFALYLATLPSQALALPVNVVHIDTPDCDPLFIPSQGVHEIGDVAIFPSDEALFATDQGPQTSPHARQPTLQGLLIRSLRSGTCQVVIGWRCGTSRAQTPRSPTLTVKPTMPYLHRFTRRSVSTTTSSIRVVSIIHLVFESMTPDGIWEAGESWRFILQDYANTLGLPPSAINSLGVGSASMTDAAGMVTSSGSIIGITIPEPSTCLLMAFGMGGIVLGRRGK